MDYLKRRGFDCAYGSVPVEKYIDRMLDSKFVLSPPGAGPQCYRTWEILALGAVPIIERNPFDKDLYDGLPILEIDPTEWEKITPEWLEEKWKTMITNKNQYDLKRLFTPYWFHKFTSY